MHVDIKPAMTIDTFLLEQQRELIGRLVASLECGRTGIAFKFDLDELLGIQGTLDAIGNAADRADSVDSDDVADPEGKDDYENCRENYADV